MPPKEKQNLVKFETVILHVKVGFCALQKYIGNILRDNDRYANRGSVTHVTLVTYKCVPSASVYQLTRTRQRLVHTLESRLVTQIAL